MGVLFADLFRELESDDGVLSSLDEVDLFCLHTTFLEGYETAGNLYAIARNQSEITEICLEIRNQGLENPVEIRKSARITRETPLLCLSMRSRPFAHAHLRNP